MEQEISVNKSSKYKDLLSEKQYLKDLFGTVVTRFGDGIDSIAFAWLVYQITGSSTLLAFTFAINGLPNLIFGMISGVVASYYSKKIIMFICDAGRGILAAITAILYITGVLETWHLMVITFLMSSFEAFRGPAATALYPHLIDKEKLDLGMALNSSLTQVIQFLGIAIAPIFIAVFDLSGALIIDSITFFICGIVILTIQCEDTSQKNEKISLKGGLIDFKDGLKFIKENKLVINICVFGAIANALMSPLNSLAPAYVANLGMGSEGVSLIEAPMIIAMAIGGILYPKLNKKIKAKNIFIMFGVLMGITYVFMAFIGLFQHKEVILTVNNFFFGIGVIFVNMPIQIAMMSKIDGNFLSRVSAIMSAALLCSMPIASFISGILVNFVSVETLFIIVGVGAVILFIIQHFNKVLEELN